MKYQIRQHIFSFGDDFSIKDEMGNERYLVTGKIFSFGDKLGITDLCGNELFYIEQQLFTFLPEYFIYAGGQQVASVKKELTFFTPRFDIDSVYGNYEIVGDLFSYDFQIQQDGRIVAAVSKDFFSFGDTYGVEIADGEDHAFFLALVIVIDQVLHDEKRR